MRCPFFAVFYRRLPDFKRTSVYIRSIETQCGKWKTCHNSEFLITKFGLSGKWFTRNHLEIVGKWDHTKKITANNSQRTERNPNYDQCREPWNLWEFERFYGSIFYHIDAYLWLFLLLVLFIFIARIVRENHTKEKETYWWYFTIRRP